MSTDARLCLDDQAAIDKALSPLTHFLGIDTLHTLAKRFGETYTHLAQTSQEHFLATAVTTLPTGRETGNFLAIDFGGTNLRVGLIELLGDRAPHRTEHEPVKATSKVVQKNVKSWPIGDHLKHDRAEDLFAWIGNCIAEIVRGVVDEDKDSVVRDEIPLGVTFSFPVVQTDIRDATIMAMGKGFAVTSELSLAKMLLDGYARHCTPLTNGTNGVNGTNGHHQPLPRIRIAAISNDTVATYFSLVYATRTVPNRRTAMGLICGTGCNATIPLPLSALHPSKRDSVRLAADVDRDKSTVVINTEWTIRGVDIPLKELSVPTKWDGILDAAHEAPGFQPFEYMLAGRYFGELVRIVFVGLLQASLPLDQRVPEVLLSKNAISTDFLSRHADQPTASLLKSLRSDFPVSPGSFAWELRHAHLLKDTARAAQRRGSALVATAIVGLLTCAGELSLDSSRLSDTTAQHEVKQTLVAAYCGAMFARYPCFLKDTQDLINELVRGGSERNTGVEVRLQSAVEGGVIGAAVLAGMAEGLSRNEG